VNGILLMLRTVDHVKHERFRAFTVPDRFHKSFVTVSERFVSVSKCFKTVLFGVCLKTLRNGHERSRQNAVIFDCPLFLSNAEWIKKIKWSREIYTKNLRVTTRNYEQLRTIARNFA
jgi:hypothetical protein